MPKFTFKKLIRDNILEKHLDEGHHIDYKLLTGIDLKEALRLKLHEEADEIPVRDKADDEIVEEIADVQQIIDDLKAVYGLTDADVSNVQQEKLDKKGGFQRGVYVEAVELEEDDKWTSYYRDSPMKYYEVLPSADDIESPPIELGLYKHYKGNYYEVLGVAFHSETLEPLVVYKPLYVKGIRPEYCVRPYDMFIETVEIPEGKVKRFQKIN